MNSSAYSGGGQRRRPGKRWRVSWLAGMIAAGGMFAGGQASPTSVSRRDDRPDNIYAYPARLSLDFRRVAVLPLAAENPGNDLSSGCSSLAPVLWEQLGKTKKFEIVAVDATALRQATGQSSWTGTEMLPADFFGFIRREYGCDGVLFAELTAYRAYAPLAIGWRFKLVDVRSGQIIWAADQMFDAANPAVSRAAQRFAGQRFAWLPGHEDNWQMANSPSCFGRYAATALLDTLPQR